jgi:cell division protein FtsA
MESLKIRDKRTVSPAEEEIIKEKPTLAEMETERSGQRELGTQSQNQVMEEAVEKRRKGLTFGQSLMEKVKKFFEEVE